MRLRLREGGPVRVLEELNLGLLLGLETGLALLANLVGLAAGLLALSVLFLLLLLLLGELALPSLRLQHRRLGLLELRPQRLLLPGQLILCRHRHWQRLGPWQGRECSRSERRRGRSSSTKACSDRLSSGELVGGLLLRLELGLGSRLGRLELALGRGRRPARAGRAGRVGRGAVLVGELGLAGWLDTGSIGCRAGVAGCSLEGAEVVEERGGGGVPVDRRFDRFGRSGLGERGKEGLIVGIWRMVRC